MSGGYLVLAWATDDEAAYAQAQAQLDALPQLGWRREYARPGLAAWVRGLAPPPAQATASGGVVIGRTLPRLGCQPAPTRDRRLDPAAPVAAAARLCHDVWGGFVAVIPDRTCPIPYAFRDPSGAVDALTWRRGGLAVLASDVDALPRGLAPDMLALDWDVIVDFLRRPASLAGRCALRGLATIAPGSVHPLGQGGETATQLWTPLDWIGADLGDPRAGPERLRRTVVESVCALASEYGVLIAEVSGGLDSSIVAAALGAGGLSDRVIAAVHYTGDLPESDERRWAEQVCGRWGLPLVCAARPLAPFDPEQDLEPLARGARPPVAALDGWRDRDLAARLRQLKAQALFTGVGGDAVFFQMPTAAVLADLYIDRGPGALADPLVRDVARWLRRSVWSVAAEGVAAAWRKPRPSSAGALLGPRACVPPQGEGHPWQIGLADAPPAKRLQIQSLAALQGLLGRSRRTDQAAVVHPLLSQPVMELCLSVPAWRHVEGGRDRALAREAMRGLLPDAVVHRRSKGELTSHFARRAAASLEVLKPYLLDGALVRADVLDAKAVEAALDPDTLIRSSEGLTLISAAAVEAWVRWWQSHVPDSAAAPRRR